MLRYATVFKARPRFWLVLLLLSLAAFLLRIFRLEYQSLWYDEAFSIYLSAMGLGDIAARTAADIQPPLYYYLLHFWMGMAGNSEFGVRFLSLFFGVLTVPLMFATGRRAFTPPLSPPYKGGAGRGSLSEAAQGRAPFAMGQDKGIPVAIFSALLALFSPLYLWYSQETRMYSLLTFLALLSSYSLLRALENARRKWWLAYALANVAAVYTHYFAFVIIAFQLVFCLWRVLPQASPFASRPSPPDMHRGVHLPPILRNSLLSLIAVVAAFLPWLPFALSQLGEDASYWRGPLKIDEAIRHIFINFTMGESVLESIAQNIAAAWLLVLLVGLLAWTTANRYRHRERESPESKSQDLESGGVSPATGGVSADGLSFSILYLIIPLALLLLLFYRNPKFNARYLMIASPGLYLLLAAGLTSLWILARRAVEGKGRTLRRAAAAVALIASCALLLGTCLYADSNAFFDPAFTKADFRGVAQYITAHANGDEAIILTAGHMFPAFDYYYASANLPEVRLPDDPTLNAEHVLNFSAANEMNRGVSGRRGVWLVQWQDEVADPNGVVPLLLTMRGKEQKVDASFWQIKLRHWQLPPDAHFSSAPEPGNSQQANFKNKVELLGWDSPNPTPADQGASFDLYYRTLETLTADYSVALRIVDAEGNVWGKLDRRPAGYNYPTTRWKKGEDLFGSYTVPLLPGTPAGDYIATVTLFATDEQTGLDVLATNGAPIGKAVRIGPIPVLAAEKQPAAADLNIQHTINAHIPPFTLLGYALARDKASTGESIPLTLFWRADEKPDADYTFQIGFGDKNSAARPLAGTAFATSRWRAGEIVRGQYMIQVPPDASPGAANLHLELTGMSAQTADLLQPFTVEKTDRLFVPPPAQFKQEANFSSLVGLAGYDLSSGEIKAGETLTVTLDWKALGKMDKAYTVFVHLLDKDSKVAAQKDAQPLNGLRATPTWVEGEYVADAYPLSLKPDTPLGDYRLEIGWYDAGDPSFARLQVIDANGGGTGDHVTLDRVIRVVGSQ